MAHYLWADIIVYHRSKEAVVNYCMCLYCFSGRIGHMEDEQDLARERAALKRKKQDKHKHGAKQTKLTF